jgi:glucose-6-phosphate isomerase
MRESYQVFALSVVKQHDIHTSPTKMPEIAHPTRCNISENFSAEPARHDAMTVQAAGLRFDFSKQAMSANDVSERAVTLQQRDFAAARSALAQGAIVNVTEGRAATHMQLRDPAKNAQHDAARALADRIAANGVHTIVNLGIGGSDLGLRLADDAFRAAGIAQRVALRFCTGLDPVEWREAIHGLDPKTTVFVVASKSFTTLETQTTGQRAREWLAACGIEANEIVNAHVYATTSAPTKAAAAGFATDNVAAFDESVGGRYSVWSAINMPLRVAYGNTAVDAMLVGAHAMDAHFLQAPLVANAPVLAALTRTFNRNELGFADLAVVPYAWGLRRLAEYMQQLVMESNGKRVNVSTGAAITGDPCSAVWGTVGTAAQHAYFQWLHQHPKGAAVDFIAVKPSEDSGSIALFENAVAQSRALAFGFEPDASDAMAAHKRSLGNRPNTFISMPRLNPESFGALLAFYEASVFVEAFIAGINPFDQYGVEYGKIVARQIASGEMGDMDASTKALLMWAKK